MRDYCSRKTQTEICLWYIDGPTRSVFVTGLGVFDQRMKYFPPMGNHRWEIPATKDILNSI